MKKVSKLIVQILTVTIFNVGIVAQDSTKINLPFSEAYNITMEQSHIVKQNKYLVEEKEKDLKAAKGIHYPKIGLSANLVYLSEDLHLDMEPVKEAIMPIYSGLSQYGVFSGVTTPEGVALPDQMSTAVMRDQYADGLSQLAASDWNKLLQKREFASVNITASMPLYTGGKINAKKQAAQLAIHEANFDSWHKQNQLISELVERYFGLCLARQAELVREEVRNAMKDHLDDARKMKNEGIIANAELLHAKVYYSESERELKKAERMSTITNQALLNTMGQKEIQEVYPISSLFYIDSIQPIEYFKSEAEKNNPLLKKVSSKKELANLGVKVQNGNYLPTVALMGTYDVWNYQLSEHVPHWLVGLGLKWTIFDGAARENKKKSAKLRVARVNEIEQKSMSDIKTGVEKYYQELQMCLEQIKELETAEEFTDEYFRVRQKAFHEGMATSTNVVDANLALVKVKIEKLQAAYRFDVALAKLLEVCGISDKFNEYQTSPSAKFEDYKK